MDLKFQKGKQMSKILGREVRKRGKAASLKKKKKGATLYSKL